MKSAALNIFRRPPEHLNCAQTVIHAYRSVTQDDAFRPEDFAELGGGKAPDGVCGALYAACQIGRDHAGCLAQRFEESMGAIRCKDLKSRAIPCNTCVEVAAELLEEVLPFEKGEASKR